MEYVMNPKFYKKSLAHYKSLTTIIKEDGACVTVRCRNCPFTTNNGQDCFIGQNFSDAYIDNKIYYSAMLLSLYTEAEVLTMLIQGEFNGTNA